jgi:AraC-like DNA-binding protein
MNDPSEKYDMHTHLYFAIASTITATELADRPIELALAGEFRAMERQVASAIEMQPVAQYADLQAYADLQVLFGRHEEAEQLYRESLKAIYEDRDLYRIRSCRNAGWQAFFLQRHGAALACFRRVVEDEKITAELHFEALAGLALVMFEFGQVAACRECIERMDAMAAMRGDARWIGLAALMRRDLVLQARLRSHAAMVDHVFWRAVVTDFRMPGDQAFGDAESDAAIRACPALAVRDSFLRRLAALADGDRDAAASIVRWMRASANMGNAGYQRTMKLDAALAALCGGSVHVAEQMLESLGDAESGAVRGGDRQLDYLYCLAEIACRQGRWNEFETRYRRYALLAVKRARDDAGLAHEHPLQSGGRDQLPAGDDISARLIGKYRRAYAYLIENLDRPDLSVKEIAAHIGVTERALQLTFRNSLGISPSQLIRRLRMERIHKDLMQGGSRNVLEVAIKWGVRHRSTLANSYRKEFNESPSETIMRSAA